MNAEFQNRRRQTRWSVQLLATCAWQGPGPRRETEAWVKDVNEGGLCLESRPEEPDEEAVLPFRPGRKITVRGFFYDERGDHPVEASVRWVHLQDEGGWSAGLELMDAPDRPPSFRDFLRVVRETA